MAEALMRNRLRSSRGAQLVEMAIVMPVLLLIIAGIFDFGMLFRSWEVVTNAAREGARIGSLPGYADADVRSRVQQYMQASGVLPAAGTCELHSVSPGAACPASACSVCVATDVVPTGSANVRVRSVTVRANQTLPSLSWVGAFFGGNFGTVAVGSSSVMRAESQAQ
jgi:Flp pilus assembly protein TadG